MTSPAESNTVSIKQELKEEPEDHLDTNQSVESSLQLKRSSPASVCPERTGRAKRQRRLPQHLQDFELDQSVEPSKQVKISSPAAASTVAIKQEPKAEVKQEPKAEVKVEDLDLKPPVQSSLQVKMRSPAPASTVSVKLEPKTEIEIEIEDPLDLLGLIPPRQAGTPAWPGKRSLAASSHGAAVPSTSGSCEPARSSGPARGRPRRRMLPPVFPPGGQAEMAEMDTFLLSSVPCPETDSEVDEGPESENHTPQTTSLLPSVATPGTPKSVDCRLGLTERVVSVKNILESPYNSQRSSSSDELSDTESWMEGSLEEWQPWKKHTDDRFVDGSCDVDDDDEDVDVGDASPRGGDADLNRPASVSGRETQIHKRDADLQRPGSGAQTGKHKTGHGCGHKRVRVQPPASTGWRSEEETPWCPLEFPFTAQPGPMNEAAALQSERPVDFLGLFLTEEVLQTIVDQTNIYAAEIISTINFTEMPGSKARRWKPVTVEEMKKFLGLFFLTGLVWKPEMELYWRECVHETPYFGKVMPRNRFQLIFRFLHFSNAEDTGTDRLYKIRPVLDYLVSRFQAMYQPSQDISIDEGTLLNRGRLGLKVYNPMKPVKYGIKSYILCDSATGYCHNIRPYCGQHASLSATVHSLLGDLEGQGYKLFMDNFYNSVGLCNELLAENTHACGTIRANRGCPEVIQKPNLRRGERVVRHQDNVMVMAWRDANIVRMVSTFHHNTTRKVTVWRKSLKAQVEKEKPDCVLEYNKKMNGVDKLDQNLSFYPCMRKSYKWTNKFMLYMFSICMFNSFVVYRARNPEGTFKEMLGFIEAIVQAWTCPNPGPRALAPDPRAIKSSRHRSENIPPTNKKYPTRICQVCSDEGKKRCETRHQCAVCLVPLHKMFCFDKYHNNYDFATALPHRHARRRKYKAQVQTRDGQMEIFS